MPELIGPAKCVLFDFDGPVCHLFHRRPAPGIAARLYAAYGHRAALPEHPDPQVLLAAAFADPGLVADGTAHALEADYAEEERLAARLAEPTPDAHALIHALARNGRALAVTTNNAPSAVRDHLTAHGLARYFEGHVHGRIPEAPLLLKPDPACVLRALETTGAAAADTVLIGDAPSDLLAARAAGVRFVGYAYDPDKRAALHAAGADPSRVLDSLAPLLRAVDPPAPEPVPVGPRAGAWWGT